MRVCNKVLGFIRQQYLYISPTTKQTILRGYHGIPFIDLYQRTTGEAVSDVFLVDLKKRYPTIDSLSHDRLQCTLQILEKFSITAQDACQDIHVFAMHPITMDNYAEILKECGFTKILPKHIIRYHTLVRSRTISRLKKEGLLENDLDLEELLKKYLPELPVNATSKHDFPESTTNILTVRMSVLENYLRWRLLVTPDEFRQYCRNYLPLKHKPMSDIQGALDIAQNDIGFEVSGIRKNGFIISADPVNTKLIIDNVGTIAGMDIREAIKLVPAILKNNYNALLQIRDLLEEFRIPVEAQKKCLRVYCMCPRTVKTRLEELRSLKEYQVLKTNPRVLSMVVHKKKMMERLEKIYAAKKQCYSLNHLVSSSKIFNNYISNFGNKICARDLTILISSSLQLNGKYKDSKLSKTELSKYISKQFKRHKYWLYTALKVVDENINYLKGKFDDRVIINNCQLLLYPSTEIEQYIELILKMRNGEKPVNESCHIQLDASYGNFNYRTFSDDQILSLVLYEIEKKYHFSGDGIWTRQDGVKVDSQAS